MKLLSSFTYPGVVANLYEFLSSVEHKGRYLKNVSNQTVDIPHWLTWSFFMVNFLLWKSIESINSLVT